MPLTTTTIGAYPKPSSVPIMDWFAQDAMTTSRPTEDYESTLAAMGNDAEAILAAGTREVIEDQERAGIDILTDGEVRRENYIHYHCRHLKGFDFAHLATKSLRGGAYETDLPRIVGPVAAQAPFLPHDWRVAQSFTERPVKMTLPGPMTIVDTTADEHYGDPKTLGRDLAEALNAEIRALAEAGCSYIQVDEPLFARRPQDALDFGIENLERCWHGVSKGVTKAMHMCCGYPNYLGRLRLPEGRSQRLLRPRGGDRRECRRCGVPGRCPPP